LATRASNADVRGATYCIIVMVMVVRRSEAMASAACVGEMAGTGRERGNGVVWRQGWREI
jgi:hypothetical protein